jgi:hypothetical protein
VPKFARRYPRPPPKFVAVEDGQTEKKKPNAMLALFFQINHQKNYRHLPACKFKFLQFCFKTFRNFNYIYLFFWLYVFGINVFKIRPPIESKKAIF